MSTYEHRKAAIRVFVKNSDGSPVSRTGIRARLSRHKFLFGAGAFDFLAYAGIQDETAKDKFAERIRLWKDVFNYGTLPFYWGRYEPEEGHTQKDAMTAAADMMAQAGAFMKGHPLCWHTVCADWLLKYPIETIMEKQLARITREVGDFKGKLGYWDVINETAIMPIFDKYDNAVTRLCNHYGRIPLIKAVFETAKAAAPDAVLLINDFNTSEEYAKIIEQCLDAGVPIDVIGIQSHQHQGYWGAEKLEAVLARFERFGLPIHFTENTLISGELMPPEIEDLNDYHNDNWVSTPEYEQRQKREAEEMYRILFDHPLVEGITSWDFTDGMWLGAPSGLIRKDNTIKPVYEMLKGLIRSEWSTDCTVTTDENGCFELSGFKGDYELTIGGKTVTVTNDGNKNECAVVVK